MKESVTYQAILEKAWLGRAKGERSILLLMGRKRLGRTVARDRRKDRSDQ